MLISKKEKLYFLALFTTILPIFVLWAVLIGCYVEDLILAFQVVNRLDPSMFMLLDKLWKDKRWSFFPNILFYEQIINWAVAAIYLFLSNCSKVKNHLSKHMLLRFVPRE